MLYCYLLITLYRTLMYVSSVFYGIFYYFCKLFCNKKAPLTMLLGRLGNTIAILFFFLLNIKYSVYNERLINNINEITTKYKDLFLICSIRYLLPKILIINQNLQIYRHIHLSYLLYLTQISF